MNVALGWHFYSADFSINAGDPDGMKHGTVTLVRDLAQRDIWHKLSDAQREDVALFATGRGVDFHTALQDANSNAMSQPELS